MVGLPSNEEPLEYSLYHFYIWKERQTMIREESARKYELNNVTNGTMAGKNYAADKTISGTFTGGSNAAAKQTVNIDDDDNLEDDAMVHRNEASPFEKSYKYRRVWNYIARLFPEIAAEFSVDKAAATVPEVYRRYTEFSKLEDEVKVLRQKRSFTEETAEEAQRKRARVEVLYPWRQAKGNKPQSTEVPAGQRIIQGTAAGRAFVSTSNISYEVAKTRFENYLQNYKSNTPEMAEMDKNRFFVEACEHLKAFKRADGMFSVSKKRHRLVFNWVTEIITAIHTNEITKRQVEKLLAIGFLTKKNDRKAIDDSDDDRGYNSPDDDEENNNQGMSVLDSKWNEKFKELVYYNKIHGDFVLPRGAPGDRSMHNWVYHQRKCYRENKLSREKIKKLESIGFTWEISKNSSRRRHIFVSAEDTKGEYHINFIRELDLKEPKEPLYSSEPVINPRDAYVRPKDEVQANSNSELSWYKQFLELVEYKEIYGHTRISFPKENDAFRLVYFWIEAQKKNFRNNRLRPNRAQSLRNVGVKLPKPKEEGEGRRKSGKRIYEDTPAQNPIVEAGQNNASDEARFL